MTRRARRFPILATTIVLAAVATMLWLGVWQLQRARWKESLLASYAAAAGQPVLAGLPRAMAVEEVERLAFRRARIVCTPTGKATQIGGRNRAGQTGYRSIVACRLGGAPARRIMLDLGWSAPGAAMAIPAGPFPALGRLIPDAPLAARVVGAAVDAIPLLLVAETPAPGFQPSIAPSIADIPNNHRAYAVQWFLFAAVAFTVYLLALRRRRG